MRKLLDYLDYIAATFARGGRPRSGPRRLAVSGRRSAVWAVLIVAAQTLVTLPAAAQNRSALSPSTVQPVESAGEVVLTFTSSDPGRVVYYTSDGDCSRYPWDPSDCGRPQARAGEDYKAVKGEWIFTEAGSRTIRIEIFDDDLDEADHEAFGVHASRYDDVAEQTTWEAAVVRIVDDDGGSSGGNSAATATRSSTKTAPAGGQSSGSAVSTPGAGAPGAAVTADPAAPTTATPPSGDLILGAPKPVPDRAGGGGGSASGLAIGLGIALVALVVGTLAVRRRRRWSATQV